MFMLDTLFELAAEITRSLLIDGLVESVTERIRRPSLRGMHAVRRHVHRQCRRRLFQRLST